MNQCDTLVVLDTCVLLKQRVADVMMHLRAEGLFSAHWTESIDIEFCATCSWSTRSPRPVREGGCRQ